MTEKWYAKSVADIEVQLSTDGAAGLSPKLARARLREEGQNEVFLRPHTSALSYAAYVCSDVSMLLLALTAVLAVLFEQGSACTMILSVLALFCAAAVFTYIKARRILESTAGCTAPRARVLRGGRLFSLDARELARGDLLLLREGDVIPADARLIGSAGLEVLEYAGRIDGKPRRVRTKKNAEECYADTLARPVSEQRNMVFAGSVVLGGEGRAIVVETGEDTFFVAAEGQIPLVSSGDRLPALEALRRHCGRSSLVMLALILPLTALGLFIPGELTLLDYFMLALSLAVSSMSELTAAIGYIVVGAALLDAAKRTDSPAIMPRLSALPTLARFDTLMLCDDIALTEGRLSVTAAWCGTSRAGDGAEGAALCELYETALIAAGLPGNDNLAAADQVRADVAPSVSALIRAAGSAGVTSSALRDRISLAEFSPAEENGTPFATALILEGGAPYAVCCGDMSLLARCTRAVDVGSAGGTCLLRAERREALLAAVAEETAAGGYAVAYARRSSPYNNLRRLSILQDELLLIGVLVFRDPVGAGVPAAAELLRRDGVRILLCAERPSGGGSIAALAHAANLGETALAPGFNPASAGEGAVVLGVGSRIEAFSSLHACAAAATCAPVTYRYRPERRALLSLTNSSESEGKNEETGEYGTGVLVKNAGLLLRRPAGGGGGLSGILTARAAARRIEVNLASALRYLLSAQTARLAAVALLLALRLSALTPLQLLISGFLLDFGAILVCAFDREGKALPPDKLFERPWRSSAAYLGLGGLSGAAAAFTAWLLSRVGMLKNLDEIGGFTFTTLLLSQVVMLIFCRRAGGVRLFSSRIGWLYSAVITVMLVLCYALPAIGAAFGITALSLPAAICLAIPPILAGFVGEILHIAAKR